MASRLLQPSYRCGAASPGAEQPVVLAGRTGWRNGFRARTVAGRRATRTGRDRSTGFRDYHRRWRRGQCRCRNVTAGGLCRFHHSIKRRCIAALRPPQSVEGLSRRLRVGRLDSVAVTGLLHGAAGRAETGYPRHRNRARCAHSTAVRRQPTFLWRAAARHRRRAHQNSMSRALRCRMSTCYVRSPTAVR